MRRILTLLGFAYLGGCGSSPTDPYAVPALRAAVGEFNTRFGPGTRLWLDPSHGVKLGEDTGTHLALVQSATDLPIWANSLGPPHPGNILINFDRLAKAGDDTFQLRAHTLVPFEVRGDTIRYDQLVWKLQLRCSTGACLIARAEMVEQALLESVPMSAHPDGPSA